MLGMDAATKKVGYCQLVGTVTVGPKGQVVIPAEVRSKMGVKPGDKLVALYIPHKRTIGFVIESDAQAVIDRIGARMTELNSAINNN
jgi:AbrB family looped-hinge helix DNA binding protein